MILRIIVSESDGTNMYSDFTLIPKTTILGINTIVDDLFLFFEQTDIPEMKYEDLCFVRERVYALSWLTEKTK